VRIRRPGGLWRHPDFLRLWGAQTISAVGTQITLLALPLTAILVLDASAFAVAALSAVEWTPWLLFSLPAGAWVDRLRRRPVLVVADVGRAAALASIPAAYAADGLTLGHLYVVAFVVGTLTVFFDVADRAYLPSLVRRDQLGDANAKLETSRSAGQFAGPGVGGALVELLSAPVAILADAVSFAVSALLLGRIRRREAPVEPELGRRLSKEIVDGIRFVVSHPFMRPGMAFTAASNFFFQVGFSIFLVYAVRELGISPGLAGLILSLGTAGGIAGALAATRIGAWLGIGPTMIATAFTLGWPLLLIPLAPAEYAVPIFVATFAVLTFAGVVFNVVVATLFQAITPDRLLGRTTASRRLVVFGAVPLGALVGGALASTIGLRETLWVSAVGASVAFLPLLSPSVRSLRELPEPA
jgi:MFS family permease